MSDQGKKHRLQITVREMISVRYVNKDRNHAECKCSPAPIIKFPLPAPLRFHLAARCGNATYDCIPLPFGVLGGLVGICIRDLHDETDDGQNYSQNQHRHDRN